MAWVNLNDVYVNKTGGTITGDLTVNGSIKVNNGNGDGRIYNVANEITTLRNSVYCRILSEEIMNKGISVDIPGLNEWAVIGALVPVTADGRNEAIIVPCSVVNGFVSGSLCYCDGPDSSLVTVTMRTYRYTELDYVNCTVQQVGYQDGVVSRNQPIAGIVGLIHHDPRLFE